MTIHAVSFGKTSYSDKGNKYEKTNAGGLTGLAVGAGFSAYKIADGCKKLKKNMPKIEQELRDSFNNIGGAETLKMSAEEYMQLTKKSMKTSKNIIFSILTLGTLGLGFGLGKIADKIINTKRANAADKAAAQETEQAK